MPGRTYVAGPGQPRSTSSTPDRTGATRQPMHFDLLNGIQPLVLLLGTDALLGAVLVYPLCMRYPDDQGDGLALVLLPKPKLPSYWLVPGFAALFVTSMVVY